MNLEQLKTPLSRFPAKHIVFLGLGNRLRGDDAAGLLLTEHIDKSGAFPGARFVYAGTNPENHLTEILASQPKLVVIIDVSHWGGMPGEIAWLGGTQIEQVAISTHAYSIGMIENYLKMNGVEEVRYLVIEPGRMDLYSGITDSVWQAIEKSNIKIRFKKSRNHHRC